MKQKKSLSREEAEVKEGMTIINNEVPTNRVQDEQQVATTEDANKTKVADSNFRTKRTKGRGSEVKQQVISDILTGSSNSAGIGVNAAGRSVSGTGGGILGANNSTPQADKSRSGSRVWKKLDRVATKLNYTPSEQVLLEVDESKPLAAAAGDDQGYNGTYRNEFARSQKIMGAVPADLMYQRSVDLILNDKLYWIEGQMCLQGSDNSLRYTPTSTVRFDELTGEKYDKDVTYNLGNFLHRNLHFGLSATGQVIYFYADVVDISVNDLDAEDMNMASAHKLIKSNVAELDRMSMDSKAGDEKADIWTPLARAINEPTRAAFLMSSIEAITGAYVYLAYSKATTNMSFQLNRGPKDGLDEVTPAIEQCIGWRCCGTDSLAVGNVLTNSLDNAFSQTNYRAGDPSLMIAAYDSVNKYHNKADLLLQPRGWRMHLQTADNNMNPLHVPVEFANTYVATEVFSTIDHDYDPLLPICMTDKANLIAPINLNELCGFYKNGGYTHVNFEIEYDTTASYSTYSHDVTLAAGGVASKMGWDKVYVLYKMNASTGYSTDAYPQYNSSTHKISLKSDSPAGSSKAAYDIVVVPDKTDYTGYTALVDGVTASSQTYDIVLVYPEEHENGIEVVDTVAMLGNDWEYLNGGHYTYFYSDLRNNYTVDVKVPLIEGIVSYLNNSIGGKIRSLINQTDFCIPMVFSTQYMTLAQIFICAATPWITRVRENSLKDVIYYEDNIHEYPYSKLDSLYKVPFKNYVNFNYSDYDSPLETKVMNPVQAINWTMPEFFWKVGTEKYVLPWYFNEVDLNSDGTVNDDAANMSMPSIRSGVRLGLLDNFYGMSEKDIRLSIDRMTKYLLKDEDIDSFAAYKYGRTTDGQIFVNLDNSKLFTLQKVLSCPRELGLSCNAPLGVLTVDPADIGGNTIITTPLKALTADGTATAFRIKVWTNKNTYVHPTILSQFGVNITRAANYTQKWFEICANNATSNTDIAGLVFGMGDDTHQFTPFAALDDGAIIVSPVTINSYQRSLNTRLQFLPFVISPFDGNYTGDCPHDIYDFAYMFGLCGFRASDYRESVYNREKRVVNDGLLFVSDPWVEDSPILKGGALSNGLIMSKGYELK